MDGEKQKTKRGKQKNRMFSQRAALVQMYRDGISPTQMRERLGFHDISKATFSRHMKTILAEDLPMLSAQVAFSTAQGAYGKQSYAPPPVAAPERAPDERRRHSEASAQRPAREVSSRNFSPKDVKTTKSAFGDDPMKEIKETQDAINWSDQ